MTVHTPNRCSKSVMVQRGSNEVVLLDTGNYPANSNFLNQTFTWNGTDWSATPAALIDAAGPLPGRINHVMAYDGYNVMLHAGQGDSSTSGLFQDTWTFGGSSWVRKSPATVPFGRTQAEACRSTTTSIKVVMFGGFGGDGSYLNQTWEWDGYVQTWTLKSPATSPSSRVGHCMASGPTFTVMFGGSNSNSQLNDTYKWDGTTWTALTPTTPPSIRSGAVMAYDVTNTKFVLFGGSNEYNYLPETWSLNATGTAWTQLAPATSPPGLINAQMCWDTQSARVLLFGGITATTGEASNDTWSFNGATNNWTKL